MKNRLLFFSIILTTLMGSVGFSQENYNHDVIQFLLEKNDSSIAEYKEKDTYFSVDRLYFLLDGIFIQSDEGELFPLSHISFKDGRYYLAKTSGYVCRNCGARYLGSKPAYCSICGRSEFDPYWDCNQ